MSKEIDSTGAKVEPYRQNEPVETEALPGQGQHWLLVTLERMLAIEALDLKTALGQASDLIIKALSADNVDIFLHDSTINSLVAVGISHTPLSRKQVALGLDRASIANGGRSVEVFLTGHPHLTGHAELDLHELPGVKEGLSIKSVVAVPLYVVRELRGVIQVDSLHSDAFSEYDLRFMEAVASWIGTITHRAELIEQIRRETQEEARRTVGEELVTIIAHDLGNYLTPLFGRVELMQRQATKEGHQRFMQDTAALRIILKRLENMVRELTDVKRLERGVFTLFAQPVNLVELAQTTATALSTSRCPVQLQANEAELLAKVDPDRVRQALENLLSNAIKHSPAGASVTLGIRSEKGQDETGWAIFTVSDQGPGINPDILPRLFTRFAAGTDSTGLGLGLYLARGIAQAHEGSLTLQTEPTGGVGTTFRLALPLATE